MTPIGTNHRSPVASTLPHAGPMPDGNETGLVAIAIDLADIRVAAQRLRVGFRAGRNNPATGAENDGQDTFPKSRRGVPSTP
jgi:hypothetical protein